MKEVIFKNKKVFYRVEGQGNPVMLIHGFAEDGSIWNHQVENLKQKFQFIIPDLPGSGSSEMLEGKTSMSDYADVVKAIADVEIKKASVSFTIIGHSMGGYVSLAFAEKYPEKINGIGLFHSTSFADDDQKKDMRNKGIGFIQNNGAATFLKNTSPNLFSQKTKKENPALVENLIELSKKFAADSLIQYYEAMRDRPDRSYVLKSFERPVLFIQGLHDTAVPLKSGLEQAHLAPVTYFEILKDSGHMGMWEDAPTATTVLDNFLMQL
ncbi:MAG: alpha/beta hydrolase [Ginsengibacter sp.]